jgi:hypothetical protein
MSKSMSNNDYLPAEMCPPEFPRFLGNCNRQEYARPPVGVWFAAAQDGIVGGGWGSDWEDDGINVVVGQRVRLVSRGSAWSAAKWEVEE